MTPTAPSGRWAFFPGRPRALAAAARAVCLALLPLLGACGGPAAGGCRFGADWVFPTQVDSIGLELFTSLPETERERRRVEAAVWMAESGRNARLDLKIQALTNAAGLAPDDPAAWLQLAELQRWTGGDLQAKTSLDLAAAAVRDLAPKGAPTPAAADSRKQAALRTALLRAWLHYDRAEWRDCMSWARSAGDIQPGNAAVRQIMGLAEARLGNRSRATVAANELHRTDEFSTDVAWIMGCVETAQGRHREGFNYVLRLRPEGEHTAECWRDMGMIAEATGEWSYAESWHRQSAAALPFADRRCLTEVVHARLAPGPASGRLPVWLAGDRAYVTGSRSAYAALAWERFIAAADAEEREYWAGAAVNAAGICLRLNLDRAWALRVKGLVFAATGMQERAVADLGRAAQELAAAGFPDPVVEAELGRLLLLRHDNDQALVHLRRAVALDDGAARPWSDLGLVLILSGDREGADLALSRAIALDPALATAWYNRGLLSVHTGDLERAEDDLLEAARLAPGNQEVMDLLQRVRLSRRERSPD